MLNLNILACIVPKSVRSFQTDKRKDGHGQIDSASDSDQEYFIGSETIDFYCFKHSNKSSILF